MLEMKLSNEDLAKFRKKTVWKLKDFERKYNEKIHFKQEFIHILT
jgi:hypothetical protein